MRVFCVHFLFTQNGRMREMPPLTVDSLTKAGVLITLNDEPEGSLIQMNWEPEPDGITWIGETELAENIKGVAHLIEGEPDCENEACPYYQESIKRRP